MCFKLQSQTVTLPPYYGVQVNRNENCGTITDGSGNNYETIVIGSQCWMKENLKTTKFKDGSNITNVTNNASWSTFISPAYCWYNNSYSLNGVVYGALYNFTAVNTELLCPNGWHVPNKSEWELMEQYLIYNGYNFDSTFTDNKIAKSLTATVLWATATNQGSPGNTDFPEYRNKTSFTALPAGNRFDTGVFGNINQYAIWWTNTIQDADNAWAKLIYTNSADVGADFFDKQFGFSVRCLKD